MLKAILLAVFAAACTAVQVSDPCLPAGRQRCWEIHQKLATKKKKAPFGAANIAEWPQRIGESSGNKSVWLRKS
jgi:hypothetical protein